MSESKSSPELYDKVCFKCMEDRGYKGRSIHLWVQKTKCFWCEEEKDCPSFKDFVKD